MLQYFEVNCDYLDNQMFIFKIIETDSIIYGKSISWLIYKITCKSVNNAEIVKVLSLNINDSWCVH